MTTLPLPETIHTQRLILGRLRYEDAAEIFYAYASKPAATRWVSWQTHRSVEDTMNYLAFAIRAWTEGKDYSYTIRLASSNKLAGSVGIINNNGDLQFGYILSPTYWGKGIATEAARAILKHISSINGIKRIGTFVSTENKASVRVLEKCGLRQEALLQKWFLFPNAAPDRQDCYAFVYPLPPR